MWILLFKILPYSPSQQFPFGADALWCVASFQSRIHEEDTIIQVTCVQPIYILWYTASVTMTKEYNTHRDTLTRCYSEMCNATAYYTRPFSSLFFLSSPWKPFYNIGLPFMGYAVTFFSPFLPWTQRIWLNWVLSLFTLFFFCCVARKGGRSIYSQNLIWPHGISFFFSFFLFPSLFLVFYHFSWLEGKRELQCLYGLCVYIVWYIYYSL